MSANEMVRPCSYPASQFMLVRGDKRQEHAISHGGGFGAGAKVIALANAGGDTINSVKQAAEIGISPRSQTLDWSKKPATCGVFKFESGLWVPKIYSGFTEARKISTRNLNYSQIPETVCGELVRSTLRGRAISAAILISSL